MRLKSVIRGTLTIMRLKIAFLVALFENATLNSIFSGSNATVTDDFLRNQGYGITWQEVK
jgi:hypothetical protein